jgi:prepilin-type N-terminal cleavage/methylation domain-containing protein
MMRMKRAKRPFTLLEITICIAILGLAAGSVGWHFKTVVEAHTFHKHVDLLLTDLRKFQVVALAHEIDIEIDIHKEDGKYGYTARCDEPGILGPRSSFVCLQGVELIKRGGRTKKELTLHITHDGRISPSSMLGLYPDEEKQLPLHIDLSYHPKILALQKPNGDI